MRDIHEIVGNSYDEYKAHIGKNPKLSLKLPGWCWKVMTCLVYGIGSIGCYYACNNLERSFQKATGQLRQMPVGVWPTHRASIIQKEEGTEDEYHSLPTNASDPADVGFKEIYTSSQCILHNLQLPPNLHLILILNLLLTHLIINTL